MSPVILAILVLLPILCAIPIAIVPFKKRSHRMVYTECVVILTSVLAVITLLNRPEGRFVFFKFTSNLSISFQLDGLGSVFVALIALLWPLATLYAFEYMKHEEHENTFFMFYTMTYGVTMGIALAEDVVTMYCFYEILTLVTLPLVMHTLTREAVLASRTYLYYMIGGAAFAFIGLAFLLAYGTTMDFVAGGVIDMEALGDKAWLALLVYVMCFYGFSVKAAMWPFSGWLPKAGVAPTPVTALLHAVAVVKAGAFTIMRITYYSFGTDLLRGTWAQAAVMIPVIITIVYGCSRAVKETHTKRRMAWSTVSNLSYILFGVTLMTPAGLIGALCHMVFHAVMKISLFFCAGAVIYKSGREYVFQLDGLGRKMPKVFTVFTISALALMGVPGLCGFVSKWKLAEAVMDVWDTAAGAVTAGRLTSVLAVAGLAAILISALLTAIYTMTISVRAFVPVKDKDIRAIEKDWPDVVPYDEVSDPNWMMMVPLVIFVVAMLVLGVHPQPLINYLSGVVQGL
ncbi:MAG: proton-conducting membrane transporter [Clostridiales bacterium]|nr:proton-conducting membrane transporter [Clostridiales bacterium]